MNILKIVMFLLWIAFCSTAFAKNGIYLTAETGFAEQTGLPNIDDCHAYYRRQRFPKALRGGVGYNHDIFSWLGIGCDIGLGKYDEQQYLYPLSELTIYSRTLEFLMLTQLHLCRWDIIGKVGGLRHTIILFNTITRSEQTKIAPQASIGTAYNFSNHFAATLHYAHVFGSGYSRIGDFLFEMKNTSINELLIGFRYSFG